MASYTHFTIQQLQQMPSLQLLIIPPENFGGYELKWEENYPRLRYWYHPLSNHVIVVVLRCGNWERVYEYNPSQG